MKLDELLKRRQEIIDELDAILAAADEEKRDLTEDEEKRYTELEAEAETVEADIEKCQADEDRRARLQARKDDQKKIRKQPPRMAATYRAEDPKEFRSIGEFLFTCVHNRNDPRLYDLYEERAQSMGTGAKGGFAVPTQFRETLLSVTPQEAIFRPRCTVIEAGDPPDSAITMPALDQTGTSDHMYAGVAVQWIGEGSTKPETDMNLREVELEPKEVAGHIVTTDKLLRNWAAASSVLETQMRLATIAAEENAFYNGNGVARPLGILQCGARVNYSRATANQIAFADVAGMFARLKFGGSPVWIASQTTLPQLMTIQDAAGNYIYVQSATAAVPSTMFGYPVLLHDRSVGLGTTGDLILCDLSYYLIKNGSGPFVAASEHFYFTSNKTVIKIFWNVDGQPWLTAPIALEGSTANTVSPFVVLN